MTHGGTLGVSLSNHEHEGGRAVWCATFVVPGSIDTRTGGYEYDRRIIRGLRDRGWSIEVRELHDSFPQPTAAALEHAHRELSAIEDGAVVAVDGLAFGAMPAEVERHALRLTIEIGRAHV